jgi:hypothetical protein
MANSVRMRADQQVAVTVDGQFSDGSPAPLQLPVVWSSSPMYVVDVVPDPLVPGGTKAFIKGRNVAGTCQVTAQATGTAPLVIEVTVDSMYANVLAVTSISDPGPRQ